MKKPSVPFFPATLLLAVFILCLLADFIAPGNPAYMDLKALRLPPEAAHPFGTDPLGRDLWSMILHGGRVSLLIGFTASAISVFLAVLYGTLCGLCGKKLDTLLMSATELFMSIPAILLVVFFQAIFGRNSALSLAVVIGATSWMTMSKVVRSEVLQLKNIEYILAARTMKGNFFYVLQRHLLPNFVPAVMYMAVSNVGHAIAAEATLSFLGIGLPKEIISWGTILSLAERAVVSGEWWIIAFPGIFLITSIVSLTSLGEYIRQQNNRKLSNI